MAVKDFANMCRPACPVFCAAMGVADVHVRYVIVNRRVLGNIEATNATRGHIHTYIHR